ncbi:MAG: hypothetical protein ACRD3S_08650 [Terracidiphilus sp.]
MTIVMHPDAISCFDLWRKLSDRLAVENMDKRKAAGRSVEELSYIFQELPEARFCFDIGQARQWDPSMTEAYRLISRFRGRLAQVHVSEVATDSRRGHFSATAILAFREVAQFLPAHLPLILESQIPTERIVAEVASLRSAFGPAAFAGPKAPVA